MEIFRENIDDLNTILKIKVTPPDYLDRYNNALKKYQQKMALPGFRPGKVPAGMVKKRYGKQVLFEEINGMLTDSLHKYIYENNIEILGNPIPKNDGLFDFEHQTEFEFQYDLGLMPKFNVELSAKDKFTFYTVKINEDLVNKNIEYLRKNYGQIIHPEFSAENDVLVGDFTEIDTQGNVVAGGFFKTTLIAIEKITNNENRNKLIGLKNEDKAVLTNLTDDAAYIFEILEIPADKLNGLTLQFTLKNLSRIAPAEINQELFDKIYGSGKISSEDEMRNKIREELSVMHLADSDRKFMNEVVEYLMQRENLNLPETFLKKHLYLTNKGKITMEQVEQEYPAYSNSLKWQLMENHLLKTHKIAIPSDEVEKYIADLLKMNYVQRGVSATEEMIAEQVKKVIADEKQLRGVYERMYDQKLIELFKKTFTIENKELPYDEFFKPSNS